MEQSRRPDGKIKEIQIRDNLFKSVVSPFYVLLVHWVRSFIGPVANHWPVYISGAIPWIEVFKYLTLQLGRLIFQCEHDILAPVPGAVLVLVPVLVLIPILILVLVPILVLVLALVLIYIYVLKHLGNF